MEESKLDERLKDYGILPELTHIIWLYATSHCTCPDDKTAKCANGEPQCVVCAMPPNASVWDPTQCPNCQKEVHYRPFPCVRSCKVVNKGGVLYPVEPCDVCQKDGCYFCGVASFTTFTIDGRLDFIARRFVHIQCYDDAEYHKVMGTKESARKYALK